MNKKLIGFSIGASVLLVLLSFSSVASASASPIPEDLERRLIDFQTRHAEELQTLNAYISTINGDIPSLPSEISALINSLSAEMRQILLPYMTEPSQPEWKGITSLWATTNGLQINPLHPLWHYWGHCISIGQFMTYVLITGVLLLGWTTALILIFIISLIPWIGPQLALQIIFWIGTHWAEFVAWMQRVYENNQYGIIFFWFDPAETSSWLFNLYGPYDNQLNHPWSNPREYFLPGSPYYSFVWVKILG